MFGTFRYNKTTKDLEHIQLSSDDIVDARGHTLVACDQCRAQKLKCNGDRNTCDRCLANLSKTCTYVGRKRLSHPLAPSKRQKQEKNQNLAEPRHLEPSSTADNVGKISTFWPNDTAMFCASSPTTLRSDIERQPLFTGSDLSWDSMSELLDTSNLSEHETAMSPGIDLFETSPASYQEATNMLDGQNSLLPMNENSLCAPLWVTGAELEPREQQAQGRPRLASYSEAPSSQFGERVVRQTNCNCLHTMTQLFEDTESTVESQGFDEFMMCLGRGTQMCESVLACVHCNACTDNAMLFTSSARQLVLTAQKISSKLLLTHQAGRRRSDSSKWSSHDIGDDIVTFGRYRMEQPEMQIRLVHQIVLLHIEDLQQLLAKIKKGVGLKRKAEELLIDAECSVARLNRVIRELAK
ncbi:Zn2/Cys6 DNA-binding protein [Glarea lozoyensis ATCC 20868]|uniref:Zn2/Cys6 DNA-binding protein n=1 Tax=Glarea lozoyensis (strain ATCC 20868 / MF5171) TaxID=1116229 RepID=S3CFV0_GLAL2|nr:Zn2/Cys6 DNA-binding protein [Glarea lozoyensis ATCC 20868]EPE25382.1 Zn2/Cys6 DNA-binding protein [Glarea lozoyensis ATCC 20868]